MPIQEVIPLIPKDFDAHVIATEGVMAISAPGLGQYVNTTVVSRRLYIME